MTVALNLQFYIVKTDSREENVLCLYPPLGHQINHWGGGGYWIDPMRMPRKVVGKECNPMLKWP